LHQALEYRRALHAVTQLGKEVIVTVFRPRALLANMCHGLLAPPLGACKPS